jgi:hypothetical protein
MSFELITAINELLKEGTRDLKLRVPEMAPGEYITPNIFIGAIPPRRKGNTPGQDDRAAFPFIINRMVGGEDSDEQATVNINTICGIYTGEDVAAGEQDITNLVFRVKRLLLEQQIIEKKFVRAGALKWHMGDIEDKFLQAFPFFGGVITTTWDVPGYERILNRQEAKEVYGEI